MAAVTIAVFPCVLGEIVIPRGLKRGVVNTPNGDALSCPGFTLLEVLMVASLLAMVSLLGLTALRSSGASVNLAQAQALAQQDARAVLASLTNELEMAVRQPREDLPNVAGIQIESPEIDEDAGTAVDSATVRELTFQRPVDSETGAWTSPITFRFVNEDTNRNGVLDPHETDLDLNNRATSLIQRLEDINGDGDMDDAGERRVVGSAQTITGASFEFDGDVLLVEIEATRAVAGTVVAEGGGEFRTRVVRSVLRGTIYPMN